MLLRKRGSRRSRGSSQPRGFDFKVNESQFISGGSSCRFSNSTDLGWWVLQSVVTVFQSPPIRGSRNSQGLSTHRTYPMHIIRHCTSYLCIFIWGSMRSSRNGGNGGREVLLRQFILSERGLVLTVCGGYRDCYTYFIQ